MSFHSMKKMIIGLRYLLLFLAIFKSFSLHAQNFTQLDNGIDSNEGPVIWGDLDNDDDLDLVIGSPGVHFYENNAALGFVRIDIPQSLAATDLSLFDSDNDGDLDILVETYNPVLLINNGDWTFSPIYFVTQTSYAAIVKSSDLNNDGLEEIIISGLEDDEKLMHIYLNQGGNMFTEVAHNCPGWSDGEIHFFDFNNDQRNDFLINGQDINGNVVTDLYSNNGGFIFTRMASATVAGSSANLAVCDYNNDGRLDFIQIGNGGFFIHEQIAFGSFKDISLFSLRGSSLGVLNFDNDSDIDIIVSHGSSMSFLTNQSDFSFIETVNDSTDGYIVPGDYDNDKDIDFFMSGSISGLSTSRIFRNESAVANNVPSVPDGLGYYQDGTNLYLIWNPANDDQTPAPSLSYSVAVGSTKDSYEIVSPQSAILSGYRKQYESGNAGNDTIYMISDFSPGKYYWTVQSIDNTNLGSAFAPIDSFVVRPAFENITINNSTSYNQGEMELIDYDMDKDLDLIVMGTGLLWENDNWRDSAVAFVFINEMNGSFSRMEIASFKQKKVFDISTHDYNNDNSVDVFLQGDTSRLFINTNSGGFENPVNIGRGDFNLRSCASDINNDGKIDIFSGSDWLLNNSDPPATFFTDQHQYVAPGGGSVTSTFDFNSDGYIDFFNSGILYQNTGNSFQSSFELESLKSGTCSAGMIDDDKTPDFIYCGYSYIYEAGLVTNHAEMYLNDGLDSVTLFDQNTIRKVQGCAFLGDFDNNGTTDVFVGGYSGSPITKLYLNDGDMNFQEFDYNFNGPQVGGSTKIGDIDHDGDLDLVMLGTGFDFEVYYNNLAYINKKPQAPENLRTDRVGFGIKLLWDSSVDDHTPSNKLGYNVIVRSVLSQEIIVSPLSDLIEGNRYIVDVGNTGLNDFIYLDSLPLGDYSWSVQAIDGAYVGGEWSLENLFTITEVVADFSADTVCLGEETVFSDASLTSGLPISPWYWDFGDGASSAEQYPSHVFLNPGIHKVSLLVQSGEFRDSIEKDIFVKPKPIVKFKADPVCHGDPTTYINETDDQGLVISSWLWDLGDAQSSDQDTPPGHYYAQAGEYDVKLTVVADNGCSDTITQSIIVAAYPVVLITADGPVNFCEGEGVLLSTDENPDYNYQWKLDNIPLGDSVNSHCKAVFKGAYTVDVESKHAACLSTSLPVNVDVLEKPVKPQVDINGYDANDCPESELISIEVKDVSSLYDYQWKKNGVPLDDETETKFEAFLPEGNYTVDVLNGSCDVTSDEIEIYYNSEMPETPTIFVEGPNVWYLACSNDTASTYRWYLNDELIEGAGQSLYVAEEQMGKYEVSISNGGECFAKSEPIWIPLGTGIELDPWQNLKIYPNPTPGLFTLEMDNQIMGELIIDIFGETGAQIINIKFQKETSHFKTQIDLSGQPAAAYLIGLMLDNYRTNRTLIVE